MQLNCAFVLQPFAQFWPSCSSIFRGLSVRGGVQWILDDLPSRETSKLLAGEIASNPMWAGSEGRNGLPPEATMTNREIAVITLHFAIMILSAQLAVVYAIKWILDGELSLLGSVAFSSMIASFFLQLYVLVKKSKPL